MKTPEQFLVERRILVTTDLSKHFNLNLTRDMHVGTAHHLVEVMKAYAEEAVEEYKRKSIQLPKNSE